jgi:hypothetical protein
MRAAASRAIVIIIVRAIAEIMKRHLFTCPISNLFNSSSVPLHQDINDY